MPYPLKLGSISFDAPFEGPNGDQEGLGDLGSLMKCVIKEFPGGIVTAQLQGSIAKEIPLSGILYGANARDRSFQLQQLCDNGELVSLSYAEWKFDGFVKDYSVHVKSPFEVHFTLLFHPLVNRSTFTGGAAAAPTVDPLSDTVSNALATMNQQSTAPANGYQMSNGIQQSVTSLSNAINQQLQSNGGAVGTLSITSQQLLQGQIGTLLTTLQPLVNGSDPIASAAAAELSSTLNILNLAFSQNSVAQQLDSFRVMNPNLYQIAAFYYGDPTLWQLIATATNNAGLNQPLINDPLALGTFALVIPPNNTLVLNPPATVMSDGLSSQAA